MIDEIWSAFISFSLGVWLNRLGQMAGLDEDIVFMYRSGPVLDGLIIKKC